MPQKCKKPNSLLSGTKKRFRAPLNRILFTPVNFSVGPSLGGVLNKIFNQNRVARHGSRSWFNIRGHENPFFHPPVVNIQLVYHLPNTTGESRQAAEMQKVKQFAFRGPKTIWGATKQNFIHPCKHFRWPQLRRSAKQNFQPKWGSKTWFKIMVQYQGS